MATESIAVHPGAWFRLATGLYNIGQHEQAEIWLLRLIERWPAHGRSHHILGLIRRRTGRLDQAIADLRRATALDPGHADSRYELAMALFTASDTVGCIDALRTVLALNPDRPHAQFNLGLALKKAGADGEAAAHLAAACRASPELFAAHHELGYALLRLGRLSEAELALQRALALKPDKAVAMHQFGVVLNRQGRLEEAALALERAAALDPTRARPFIMLGLTSVDLGRFGRARDCFLRAIVLLPGYHETHFYLAKLWDRLGAADAAIDCFRRALALEPDYPEAAWELLLAMTADAATAPSEVLALQRRQAARIAAAAPIGPRHASRHEPERRLVVGYVGRSYVSVVNELTTTALRARDPARVLQVAFAAPPAEADFDPLRVGLDRLEDVAGLDDEALAARIQAMGVDILVDMDAARPGNRLGVFARRPAPVQVTWIEAFYTTGLEAIDYLLTDAVHAPPGEALPIVETPVRLPDCRFCYAPPRYAPETGPPPCLTSGTVTFGSFNALNKLTPDVIALWSEILNGVPGSRLLLKRRNLAYPEISAAYAARFAAHGIPRERLILRGHSPHAEMLSEYGGVDIALDPFPYNGGRSSCEALWMGLPLVALRGTRMIARQSASLLHTIGRPEWIAATPAGYRDIALGLARDRAMLTALRAGQRERIKASPLTDARRFARNLEAAYRSMWHHWCALERS
jgi:predicted O-linked N-acetylglucosamine transferase (SPINDLY family)